MGESRGWRGEEVEAGVASRRVRERGRMGEYLEVFCQQCYFNGPLQKTFVACFQ